MVLAPCINMLSKEKLFWCQNGAKKSCK